MLEKYHYCAPQKFSELLDQYQPDISDLTALDLGCGSGLISQIISERTSAEVMGVDISPAMLRIAEETQAVQKALCLDVAKHPLPFENASFDISFSSGLFEYIQSPLFPIKELCRVTKSGGLIGFTTQSSRSYTDRIRRFTGSCMKNLYRKKEQTIIEYYHSSKDILKILEEGNIEKIKHTPFIAYHHKGPVIYDLFSGIKK